jgi:4-diphosphocytidyl-2-C-methyl-D-erythritol kinase
VLEAALRGRNDLEQPARAIAPQIGDVLAMLSELPGTILSRMSGSGATCFALFDSDSARDGALEHIKRLRPDWWQLGSRVR